MRERGSNMSRGFCFVDFVSVDAATTLLKSSLAVEIDGRTVKMSYAKPKDSMNLVFGGKQADETLTMHARDVAQKAIAGNSHRVLMFNLCSRGVSVAYALYPKSLAFRSSGPSWREFS
jgi:RNA recognition motif-containing protein